MNAVFILSSHHQSRVCQRSSLCQGSFVLFLAQIISWFRDTTTYQRAVLRTSPPFDRVVLNEDRLGSVR